MKLTIKIKELNKLINRIKELENELDKEKKDKDLYKNLFYSEMKKNKKTDEEYENNTIANIA